MSYPSLGNVGTPSSLVAPGLELPEPFLRLPFSRHLAQGVGTRNISEGWFYGAERGIHGMETHHAIDFNLPYGADVLAPADGWAARTYVSWMTTIRYQGKRVGFGLGLWLMTLHKVPGTDVYWWTKMAHLSDIKEHIRYLRPKRDRDGDWYEPKRGRDNLYRPDPVLAQEFTPIKCGEVLGKVGDTGIEWDWRDEFGAEMGVVFQRNRRMLPPWDDDTHLHFEVFRRVNGSPKRRWQLNTDRISVDPFGLYGQVRQWPRRSSPYDGYPLAPGHLWLSNGSRPLYAG